MSEPHELFSSGDDPVVVRGVSPDEHIKLRRRDLKRMLGFEA